MLRKIWMSALGVTSVSLSFACSSPQESDLLHLTADENATNIALLFGAPQTGTSSALAGIDVDLANMQSVLEGGRLNFRVVKLNGASREDILQLTRQYASQVGSTGTLFWYYSGHGAQDGRLVPEGAGYSDMLSLSELKAAMTYDRSSPIKRLIMASDSCFSGHWVDGDHAIISSEAMNDTFSNSSLYEQALVMSAATSSETAQVLNGAVGSAFTYSLRHAFDSLESDESATIKDLVDTTDGNMRSALESYGRQQHHTVYRAFPTAKILNETLWTSRDDNSHTPPTQPGNGVSTETQHLSLVARALNDAVRSCDIAADLTSVSVADSLGRYTFRMTATYEDGSREDRYTWANVNTSVDEEVRLFLKAIPTAFFSRCENPEAAVDAPTHLAAIVAELNRRLDECDLDFEQATNPNAEGRYEFWLRARYGFSSSEQTYTWASVKTSVQDEVDAFLRAIPTKFLSGCRHAL